MCCAFRFSMVMADLGVDDLLIMDSSWFLVVVGTAMRILILR